MFVSLPFVYSFYTRISKIKTIISFLVTFLFPVVFLSYSYSNEFFSLFSTFILFCCVFLVYEIGYLYNDFHTTLYEDNPTLRVPVEVYNKIKVNYPIHIAFRWLLVIGLVQVVHADVNVIKFFFCLMLLNFSYSLHNYYRDAKNIVTIYLLMVFKYLSVPLSLLSYNGDKRLYFFLFLIPLVRAVLFTTHDRININYLDRSRVNQYRFLYYSFTTFLLLIASIFFNGLGSLLLLSICLFVFYMLPLILSRLLSNDK